MSRSLRGRRPPFPAAVAAACLFVILLIGCAEAPGQQAADAAAPVDTAGAVPDPLRVGLIPNVAPDEQRARYQPLGDYLSETLGVEVELFVAPDYAGVVTALASNQLDVAYLGGLTYLQAREQVDVQPLVTEVDRETGTVEYRSAIVVRDDSPYESLEDLLEDEASLALGDVSSTSGSLYPRIMLVEAGADCSASQIDSCPPLREVVFTGGHDAAAHAVASGTADAAGLELRILHRLEADGAIPEGELRQVASAPVMGYPWVARDAIGEPAHAAITKAFLDITDASLLDLLRAESYERVDAGDYEQMAAWAERLGLLESQ